MPTAIDIIKRSLQSINVLGTGEAPSADMAADGLNSLNDMLSSWSTQKLMVYELTLEGFSLVPGQAAYTIGPSGQFNTTRPTAIQNAYINWQGLDYPMGITTTQQYDDIPLKTLETQMPCVLLVDAGWPLTTLKLWPTPSDSTARLFIESRKPFTAFASLPTQVNLPEGYARALRYNLALELCPEYGKEPSPSLMRLAIESKKWIKRINFEPLILEIDEAIPQAGGYYDSKGNYL